MGQSRETGESSRLLVSAANLSTLLFLDASYWSRKAETGLCEQTDFKIASCRRQPCVPGCFSGHCDLAKPALRPSMFFRRLASNFSSDWLFSRLLVSAANLSTTLLLDGFCFPGASRTGLRSRLAFAKQRLATEGDWHLFFSCAAASLPRMLLRASLPGMYFPASLPDKVGLASF